MAVNLKQLDNTPRVAAGFVALNLSSIQFQYAKVLFRSIKYNRYHNLHGHEKFVHEASRAELSKSSYRKK